VPFTNGFANQTLLIEHFTKHHHEFGCTTASEYESLADAFCGGPLTPSTSEHIRSYDGTVIRYNIVTNEIGFLDANGYILTYFKPSAGLKYFNRKCV